MLESIYKSIDSGRNSIIEWQREMTARPALGPENKGEGEAEKANWLLKSLKDLGFPEIKEFNAKDDRVSCGYRPNIAAKIPGKKAQTLWLIGHMDVVPPGEEKLWSSNPYELRIDGDLIYGRGVEDNQQGIAMGMMVAKAIIDNKITPDLSLGLLLVADEETGMTKGLPYVLQESPDLIKQDDLILVPDTGNADGSMVQVAEKACLWFKVDVIGEQCHASTPDKGINSLLIASECIMSMQKLYRIFRKKNKLFTPSWSTFVPTKKEANVENINTMPGQDVFYIDCRVLPEYSLEDVERECRRITEEVAKKTNSCIKVDVVNKLSSSNMTAKDSPVVESLLKALQEVREVEGKVCGSGGQTVASILRDKNYQAVAWSTLMPNPHAPNEHSSIKNTLEDAKVVARMLFQ